MFEEMCLIRLKNRRMCIPWKDPLKPCKCMHLSLSGKTIKNDHSFKCQAEGLMLKCPYEPQERQLCGIQTQTRTPQWSLWSPRLLGH